MVGEMSLSSGATEESPNTNTRDVIDELDLGEILDNFDGCGKSDCPGYKADEISQIKSQINNLYISKQSVLEAIGEDNILTRQEADGKCEDLGTNINAYVKGGKNQLRHQIRQKLNLIETKEMK